MALVPRGSNPPPASLTARPQVDGVLVSVASGAGQEVSVAAEATGRVDAGTGGEARA